MATVIVAIHCGVSLAALVWGLVQWRGGAEPAGPLTAAFAGLALLAGLLLYALLLMARKFVANSYRAYDALLEMAETLRRQNDFARVAAENSSLSEWARRIVFREKDYEFVRETIQGAIVKQDWDAAEHLIRDLSEEFGYRDTAVHLREQLDAARRATTEERVGSALERFDQLCAARKWELARRESARLQPLFPGEPRIEALPRELDLRRQEYKRSLLKTYDDAVRAHEMDRAHTLLFELDQYLTPAEAVSLKESARSVFRAKLEQLRAEFSIAVSQRQFASAVRVGERIMVEFPNSGYAHDIGRMMPVLRERAATVDTREHVAAGAS